MDAEHYIGLYKSGVHDMRFLKDNRQKYLVIDNTEKRAKWFPYHYQAVNQWNIWRQEIIINDTNYLDSVEYQEDTTEF